jgi:hypothetical protein
MDVGTDNESIPCSLAIPKSLNPRKSSPSSSAKFPLCRQYLLCRKERGPTRATFHRYLQTSCRLLLLVQLPRCQLLVARQGTRRVKQEVDSTMIGEEER